LIESQNQFQDMMDSQSHQNFQIQDPYSMFQVAQQEEEPTDLGKSMEPMIQSQNDSFNMLEVLMSQLNNTSRVKKTLPYQYLTNSDCPSHIDKN